MKQRQAVNAELWLNKERPLRRTESSSKSDIVAQVTLNRPVLSRIAAAAGLRGSDIDDVLQDVSLQALKNEREFESEEKALCWLVKVTFNRAMLEHRKRKRFLEKCGDLLHLRPKTAAETSGNAVLNEEKEIIRKSLSNLERDLLMPLVLRYFCDLNSEDIGQVLKVNPSTVRSRLRQGRLVLAKRLLEKGIKP